MVANLSNLKQKISTYNSSIQDILTFVPLVQLPGMSSTQVANMANTWSGNNITPTKALDVKDRIVKVNDGLESLLNYMNTLSISNVLLSFDYIIQYENFKNQKVEILDTWKNSITSEFNYITTNVNQLKSTFAQARNTYNTIGNLNSNLAIVAALTLKKAGIGAAALCGTPPLPCGCDASHYKVMCDVIDNLIATLNADRNITGSIINDKIDKISSYENGETNQYGGQITVQPFVEINDEFIANEI